MNNTMAVDFKFNNKVDFTWLMKFLEDCTDICWINGYSPTMISVEADSADLVSRLDEPFDVTKHMVSLRNEQLVIGESNPEDNVIPVEVYDLIMWSTDVDYTSLEELLQEVIEDKEEYGGWRYEKAPFYEQHILEGLHRAESNLARNREVYKDVLDKIADLDKLIEKHGIKDIQGTAEHYNFLETRARSAIRNIDISKNDIKKFRRILDRIPEEIVEKYNLKY